MIWRVLGWLILAWLVFWLLGQVLSWVPIILLVVAFAVAVIVVYALLPEGFRLPAVEAWLAKGRPEPSRPLSSDSKTPNSSGSGSPPSNSGGSGHSPATNPKTDEPLNFANIKPRAKNQVPDRDVLIAKLQQKVIGQDAAIDMLVRVVRGKLAAVNSPKPLVILLPGPTGTGKTELSKALGDVLKTKLVRFDMGEFAEAHKVSNLFGSPRGYVGSEEGGALPNALRERRKRYVFLFDEVEKAHKSLWPQLLAFFDEGRAADSKGACTAPKDTICLLTSNLQADKIGEVPDKAKDILKGTGYFPPEFLGRVDKVIPLLRLNPADTARLTVMIAHRLADRYSIRLLIEQDVLEDMVTETHEEAEKYGGRGIQEKLGDLLIDDLIDLQSEQISQAQLVSSDGRLRAVPAARVSNP